MGDRAHRVESFHKSRQNNVPCRRSISSLHICIIWYTSVTYGYLATYTFHPIHASLSLPTLRLYVLSRHKRAPFRLLISNTREEQRYYTTNVYLPIWVCITHEFVFFSHTGCLGTYAMIYFTFIDLHTRKYLYNKVCTH